MTLWPSLTLAGGLRPPDPPPGGLRPPGPPEVWPSYAPVWGLCADLLEKLHFFAQMTFFSQFFL